MSGRSSHSHKEPRPRRFRSWLGRSRCQTRPKPILPGQSPARVGAAGLKRKRPRVTPCTRVTAASPAAGTVLAAGWGGAAPWRPSAGSGPSGRDGSCNSPEPTAIPQGCAQANGCPVTRTALSVATGRDHPDGCRPGGPGLARHGRLPLLAGQRWRLLMRSGAGRRAGGAACTGRRSWVALRRTLAWGCMTKPGPQRENWLFAPGTEVASTGRHAGFRRSAFPVR